MKLRGKAVLWLGLCAALFCGCTKQTSETETESATEIEVVAGADGAIYSGEPDFDIYDDITLDSNQISAGIGRRLLENDKYPMGVDVGFELKPEEELVEMVVIVKDGTSAEDAAYFADKAVKALNDEIAIQDFYYAESEEDYFGDYFEDHDLDMTIYYEAVYLIGGEPMYHEKIDRATYVTFEIEE